MHLTNRQKYTRENLWMLDHIKADGSRICRTARLVQLLQQGSGLNRRTVRHKIDQGHPKTRSDSPPQSLAHGIISQFLTKGPIIINVKTDS